MGVSERFTTFLSNITLTEAQKTAGGERREAVVKALNSNYWSSASATANSLFIGSWGKRTRVRPPRDVDVLFTLPTAVYDRFQLRTGNKQSQLLQEVKGVLAAKFPSTAIRGDGPAVLVPFSQYNVEVIPAFQLSGNGYYICMTDNGGHYKTADYDAELSGMTASNAKTNGNTRDLVKMMKTWQSNCSVALKSFWIELLAIDFLNQWAHAGKTKIYYDYMVRDFLEYIIQRTGWNVYAPGTREAMNLGNAWESRAKTALERAKKACDYEAANLPNSAGEEWQKIFGMDIPKG